MSAGLAGAIAVICAQENDLSALETALLVRRLRAEVRVVAQLGQPRRRPRGPGGGRGGPRRGGPVRPVGGRGLPGRGRPGAVAVGHAVPRRPHHRAARGDAARAVRGARPGRGGPADRGRARLPGPGHPGARGRRGDAHRHPGRARRRLRHRSSGTDPPAHRHRQRRPTDGASGGSPGILGILGGEDADATPAGPGPAGRALRALRDLAVSFARAADRRIAIALGALLGGARHRHPRAALHLPAGRPRPPDLAARVGVLHRRDRDHGRVRRLHVPRRAGLADRVRDRPDDDRRAVRRRLLRPRHQHAGQPADRGIAGAAEDRRAARPRPGHRPRHDRPAGGAAAARRRPGGRGDREGRAQPAPRPGRARSASR